MFYKLISAGGVGWLNQQLLTIRHYDAHAVPAVAGGGGGSFLLLNLYEA